ncbi:hypothetical protein LTR24_008770 [Lithohypha guttulata]|uniref:Metallo-beta-lactamase domain-containing protein n=1 Tax=Lithohypha guttulata TaxID=1690604 RepID=A0ABR0JZ99_9EURO|nr:hypothetical protein LTR24_008770 [Lithohypha guttulata]
MSNADSDVSPSFTETADFENASRGFIASISPCIIHTKDGRLAWDNDQYAFLQADCPPDTANPKLWRHSRLVAKQGLFEVTPGIYQVRGLDISHMTLVEGDTGVIVIDPLVSSECAEAAIALYRQHRGDRPVMGLIFSHSHADHFGGASGVLPPDQVESPTIPIIGPAGFLEEVLSENVFAGPAMRHRAAYMFGQHLVKSPQGQIGCGLGTTSSSGISGLYPPNLLIQSTGEEHTVDGVKMVFQMVPGTEAPAEINFYFPQHKALCIAECATHTMHNIVTLRGAQVRDSKKWAKYLGETLQLFGQKSDVLFASHHWPIWGTQELSAFIAEQRDLYSFMHDQTCRMMNTGLTGIQIAERFRLPEGLQRKWHTQGFYGSVSHNVKAIYQRYLTWFDGNPAHLWQHPPEEEGKRYVECMGGVDVVLSRAEVFTDRGDLRFAATLLDHAVLAEPEHVKAKEALANVYEKLGFGAENATWRNFYLTRAQDLRAGKRDTAGEMSKFAAINPLLPIEQWFDGLSIQLDGLRAEKESFSIDIHVSDQRRLWRVTLSNGALSYRCVPEEESFPEAASLKLKLTKDELGQVLQGKMQAVKDSDGNKDLLSKLLDLLAIEKVQ